MLTSQKVLIVFTSKTLREGHTTFRSITPAHKNQNKHHLSQLQTKKTNCLDESIRKHIISYLSIYRIHIAPVQGNYSEVELDRYIGNTHHRGRLWDNWNHRQMMTIGDQSMPMFHDDVTHRIHLAMGS